MEKRLQCVICIEADENLSALTDICSEVIGGETIILFMRMEKWLVQKPQPTAQAKPLILVLVPIPDEQIVAQH